MTKAGEGACKVLAPGVLTKGRVWSSLEAYVSCAELPCCPYPELLRKGGEGDLDYEPFCGTSATPCPQLTASHQQGIRASGTPKPSTVGVPPPQDRSLPWLYRPACFRKLSNESWQHSFLLSITVEPVENLGF